MAQSENPKISVTIITLNEESRLPRALSSLRWADEVVVVDAGSMDKTREIAKNWGAKVFENPWSGYGQQKNFAQNKASFDWILNIDADEEVAPSLAREIKEKIALVEEGKLQARGFFLPRKTFYMGRFIAHGGWYPNYLIRLANKKHSRWSEPHIHEALVVDGPVKYFDEPLHHYTFEGIEDQVTTNLRYARLGANELLRKAQRPSILKLCLKPLGKFLETYIWKRGFLDGLPGFIISVNAAHSIFLRYAYLFERDKGK